MDKTAKKKKLKFRKFVETKFCKERKMWFLMSCRKTYLAHLYKTTNSFKAPKSSKKVNTFLIKGENILSFPFIVSWWLQNSEEPTTLINHEYKFARNI